MKTVVLSDLFDVSYGVNLELNKLTKVAKNHPESINFVSRTRENNGVSAIVKRIDTVSSIPAGTISVAGGGDSILYSFLQPEPYYSGRDLFYLTAKKPMTDAEKLFYCLCIFQNRFRFSYGRQANRTLPHLVVPANPPSWVQENEVPDLSKMKKSVLERDSQALDTVRWKQFKYSDLFDIERGKGPRKKDLNGEGDTPVVTSSDKNNGWTAFTTKSPCHKGDSIGVNRNGSVGEAFYQPVDFCSTEDVHIFTPKFEMNKYVAMFLCCLIRAEKYRFNYGRKWGIARMKESIIRLPTDSIGEPDWLFMENYIKALPFSSSI